MHSPKEKIVIKANDITKIAESGSEKIQILHGVDLEVHAGETLAIRGRSGSGKSSLLVILAGLDMPSSGRLTLLGQNLIGTTESERAALRKGQVGFVFQSFQLIPALPARENVALAMEVGKGAPVDEALERADALLSDLGLGHRLHQLPSKLSGGEQQRVAIARAFINEPKVLFADEPTGNLDQNNGDLVNELLFKLVSERGSTLVLVTHDQELADRCDRQIHLNQGTIVEAHQC